jgi:DNA replication protein DnaC
MRKLVFGRQALGKQLDYLKLAYCKENFRPLAAEGNAKHWTHIDYLQRLIEGEVAARQDRTILRWTKAPCQDADVERWLTFPRRRGRGKQSNFCAP